MSPSVLGRRRSASGVGASEAKSSAGTRRQRNWTVLTMPSRLMVTLETPPATLLLEIGDVLHVLAVDRDDHVALPHEAAGIGTGLDLDDDDARAAFDQAELVGDGGRHVDDAGAGERLTAFQQRTIARRILGRRRELEVDHHFLAAADDLHRHDGVDGERGQPEAQARLVVDRQVADRHDDVVALQPGLMRRGRSDGLP